jgi:hypothetical protein
LRLAKKWSVVISHFRNTCIVYISNQDTNLVGMRNNCQLSSIVLFLIIHVIWPKCMYVDVKSNFGRNADLKAVLKLIIKSMEVRFVGDVVSFIML